MGITRVLELRIHGIANSPPADALLANDEEIMREDGDAQGSFWRVKAPAVTPPGLASLTGATDAAPQITTEAYSWGNQARSGGSALAVIGRSIVHVGWLLVLPFGLCNLAYWARRRINGEGEHPKIWLGGDGAGLIRVFALLQTLFYTVGLLAVFVHLIAAECFPTPARGEPQEVCAVLPTWLDFLAAWTPNARAALLSLAPIAVILFLYIVSRRARADFHPETAFDDEAVPRADRGKTRGENAPPIPPILGSQGFWQRTRTAETAERTHLAAVFGLILAVLAVDALLDATGLGLVEVLGQIPAVIDTAAFPFVMSVIGIVVVAVTLALAWTGALSGENQGRRSLRGFSAFVLIFAALAFAVWLVWAIWIDKAEAVYTDAGTTNGLHGMILVPTAIAALGALIALASLSWGYGRIVRYVCAALIFAALVCGVIATAFLTTFEDQLRMSAVAAVLVVIAVAASYSPLGAAKNREVSIVAGWHGNGAAVALLIAWFSSLAITSLLVLGSYALLTTNTDTPDTRAHLRTASAGDAAAGTPSEIPLPEFYSRFATMLVLIMIVIAVAVLIALVGALHRFPAFSLPGLLFPKDLTPDQLREQKERDVSLGGVTSIPSDYPTSEHQPSGRLRSVAHARRIAGLAHRGEPVLQLLAILTAAALLVLGIPVLGVWLEGFPLWGELQRVSGWALGLLALTAVAWVVSNAATSAERPLGLVWDIVCFFPRAGHPFTAPCYAERAVPEVAKRVRRFIKETRADGDDPYVILSAHSMGATIAIAALFMLELGTAVAPDPDKSGDDEADDSQDVVPRVALLTHGVQIRAYFSRFFPEVFGPRVLGTRGTRGPSLVRTDPWKKQVIDEARQPRASLGAASDAPTLVSLLGGSFTDADAWKAPRWRNLWRRTDYLGFPVLAYPSEISERDGTTVIGNPIDRGATERCPSSYLWKIARHNDYLSTAQYREARDELVDQLREGSAVAVTAVSGAR